MYKIEIEGSMTTFIMPFQKNQDVFEALIAQKRPFRTFKEIERVKKWTYQLSCALNHIHSHGLSAFN